jgi:hypothetical protein
LLVSAEVTRLSLKLSRLWPSCAFSTESAAMAPAAPGRFSTMIVVPPNCPRRRSAASRATTSELPPAWKPTTTRSGRSGQPNAAQDTVTKSRDATTNALMGPGLMVPPSARVDA